MIGWRADRGSSKRQVWLVAGHQNHTTCIIYTKAMNKAFLSALYQHYITPPEQVFPRFKLGAVIFFWGLIVIYAGSQLLEPSLSQELVTLLGLVLLAFGFLIALMAQIRMLIGRILRFFFEG